jgi:MFS family permease
VPRSALTEALAWTTTGLTVGVTAGSAVAGAAVDGWGARAAFAVPCVAAGLAALLALAGARWLHPAFPERGDGGDAGRRPAERTAGARPTEEHGEHPTAARGRGAR